MFKLIFLAILSAMLLIGCSMSNQLQGKNCKIVYYDKGRPTDMIVDSSNAIIESVTDLVQGADDRIRLIVTKSTIDKVKQNNCVEFELPEELRVKMYNGNLLSFSKILISFNDGRPNAPYVVFYCGKKEYNTPPYINSNGAQIAEEIRKFCENMINSKK